MRSADVSDGKAGGDVTGTVSGASSVLPRLSLAELPTPLHAARGLGEAIGSQALQLKREDLSGLGLGGNKPRQLEVLLAAAAESGADTIVTTAAAQSNFCRATAAACAQLGWQCVLLLRGDGNAAPTGNLLLSRLFGARIRWIDCDDPYAERIQQRLDALTEEFRASGRRPWQIRLPVADGPLAAAAAIGLAEELLEQCDREPHSVYLATGSGLTAAGLLAGFSRAGVRTRVVAVSVQQRREFIEPLIRRRAVEALRLIGVDDRLDDTLLCVDDGFIGPGYGQPGDSALRALRVAGRTAGLVLDPAYAAKAMAALTSHLSERRLTAAQPVVFVHTGGAPGLFAHSESVAGQLSERHA